VPNVDRIWQFLRHTLFNVPSPARLKMTPSESRQNVWCEKTPMMWSYI